MSLFHRLIRDLPIKQKMMAIMLVTTGAALLLSAIAIIVSDSFLFRTSMRRDIATLAQMIGDNTTAALKFDDSRVADEVVGSVHSRSHIKAVCLYQMDGTLFSKYIQPGSSTVCPLPETGEAVRFTGEELRSFHPVMLEDRRIGSLVLVVDIAEIRERAFLFGGIVFAILLASTLIAFLSSAGLRDVIAGPAAHLAEAAAAISKTGDYNVRVEKVSRDELGVLVDAFNGMVERIQTRELEIQNARNSLQTTLASIGDAVVSTDAEKRVAFANPVAQSLLRRPAPELIGRPIHEVFPIVNEFTREPVENPVDRVFREGAIVGISDHTLLITAAGDEIPIDTSAAPIRQNGQTVGVVLVFRDLTERRRAQQDAAYLAAIVESSDDAIVGSSISGIIQTWNAGAERLYGYKPEEAIGLEMTGLLPPDRRHEEAGILESLRNHPVIRYETARLRKDRTVIEVALTISPIRDRAGQIIGISYIAHDITEQKRTAEQVRQAQKLESLGVLAGGIAHDFNNLLTGILGNASLALDDLTPGHPSRGAIQSVVDATERAAQLARQMLAYSGKGHFVLEKIDLSARIRHTLPLIRASIPPTVELKLNLDPGAPTVEADAAQVQQVVMNLIINAAEAIPEGKNGSVTVATRLEHVPEGNSRDLAPGHYAIFEVTDTGCGMDKQTRARIFDPFFTTKFTGRGLGLAAVQGIVRGHRGSIEVQSKPGAGTTFRILLPAADPAAAATSIAAPSQPEAPSVSLRGEGLILVVDDELIVRNMARLSLEHYGYSVLVAENGAVGLDLFQREAASLKCVILDLTMPVMSGEEALTRMKSIRPEIPIVLSSGFNEAQAVRRFEGKQLAGFLQKPYKAAVLVQTVGRVISQTKLKSFTPNPTA